MKLISLLSLLGMVATFADPIRPADLASSPPWVAHLDARKLEQAKVGDFLAGTAGFDRLLQLEGDVSKSLKIDLKQIDSITLLGSGQKWQDTAILVRGTMAPRAFAKAPLRAEEGAGDQPSVWEGPELLGEKVFLNQEQQNQLVVGTSPKAVREGLVTLAAPPPSSWEALGFHPAVRDRLASGIAVFGMNMEKIGNELKFEADLTRAMKSAWFVIGSQGENIELSFFIKSADLEGLALVSQKWALFSSLLLSGEGSPLLVRQAVAGQKVEVNDDWLCITMTAAPQKVAQFLKVMAPLFQDSPGKVSLPE